MTFLETILMRKREELLILEEKIDPDTIILPEKKDKKIGLKRDEGRNIIAEVKKKSPSKGILNEGLDPAQLAGEYVEGGARAISVLTDGHFFGGSRDDFEAVSRVAGDLPLLRKDFIIDEVQLFESRGMCADMVLLIARVLKGNKLTEMVELSKKLHMEPLVEVHNEEELKWAFDSGASLIGINNRDLDTFEVDLNTSLILLDKIPDRYVRIVESGIRDQNDMAMLEKHGADSFLIGEAIIRADNPKRMLKMLLN